MARGVRYVKKTGIVLSAIFIYLIMLAAGGAAWYVISQRQAAPQSVAEKQPELTEAEKAEKAAREAAKAKERAEREAKELQEEQRRKQRENDIQRLSKGLHQETIQGVTYYKGNYESKPPPGVYLRPILAVGDDVALLRIEVFYYYTIHDAVPTAWIMGDHLDINADGQVMTLAFDPSKLHKKVASDAEWLWEKYMINANAASTDILRRAAAASSVTITYYQAASGKGRSQTLTATELKELQEVLALYDLMNQKMKEENGV